jgi:hypothetical protein
MGNRKKMAKGYAVLIVNLLTIFSVAFTTISPRQIVNLTSSLAANQAIENQPIFQLYSTISMIPINMVSKMLGEKLAGVKGASQRKAHDKSENNRACSDFSFALPNTSSNVLKMPNLQPVSFLTVPDGALSIPAGCQFSLLSAGSSQCVILLCILLFLITLRRRSLPAPYMNKTIYIKTQSSTQNGLGFLIIGNAKRRMKPQINTDERRKRIFLYKNLVLKTDSFNSVNLCLSVVF